MFVENYGPVAENETTSGIKVIYNLYREHFKTYSCQILKGLIFVASPSGTLPSLFNLWLCGQSGIFLEVTEFMRLLLFFDSSSPCRWLYAVCECGISWSYILFYVDLHIVKHK